MVASELKTVLEMQQSEWENELDRVLRENFEDEAKTLLLDELVENTGVDREIIEAILEHNGVDYD